MVQYDRYYTFENGGEFCIGYFYRGSNVQHTKRFESQAERAEWAKANLKGFRPFNV